MPSLTPLEFGQRLGLSQGADGAAAPFLDFEDLMMLNDSLTHSDQEAATHGVSSPFWTEFASLFYPSLLRTLLNPHLEDQLPSFDAEPSCLYLFWITKCQAFGSFVRRHPQEAIESYKLLATRLSASMDWIMPDSDRHRSISDQLVLIQLMQISLAFNLPPSSSPTNPLALPSATTFKIRVMTEFFETFPEVLGENKEQRRARSGMLGILGNRWNLDETRKEMLKTDYVTNYRSCELRVAEKGAPVCEKLKEGKELEACSRCYSVRYCSKDHQRADWKRHKLVCFRPTW